MKNIHRDPSYVPLKPFKEGLQKMPSPKKKKKKSVKGEKPPPSVPETKQKCERNSPKQLP
jgi:hypothetical protein